MRTFYIISETEMKEVGMEPPDMPSSSHYDINLEQEEFSAAMAEYDETLEEWEQHIAAAQTFQHRLNKKGLVSEEEFVWGWYVKTESYQGEGHHVFKTEKEAIENYKEWSQWNGNLQAFTHKPVLVAIPKEEIGLTVEKIKRVTEEACKSPESARKFLQDAGIIPKERDDEKYFFDAIQEIPLRIAIEVSNQMFCLGILSDLGYREKKSWGDDEDELYDKLMMLASKQSEHIINHLKEYSVNPEIKLKDVKEEKEERTFTEKDMLGLHRAIGILNGSISGLRTIPNFNKEGMCQNLEEVKSIISKYLKQQ